jgi:hypothetical protein
MRWDFEEKRARFLLRDDPHPYFSEKKTLDPTPHSIYLFLSHLFIYLIAIHYQSPPLSAIIETKQVVRVD